MCLSRRECRDPRARRVTNAFCAWGMRHLTLSTCNEVAQFSVVFNDAPGFTLCHIDLTILVQDALFEFDFQAVIIVNLSRAKRKPVNGEILISRPSMHLVLSVRSDLSAIVGRFFSGH